MTKLYKCQDQNVGPNNQKKERNCEPWRYFYIFNG